MNPDTQRYLELLEQRISLLGSLAESLSAASKGFASFDFDTIEASITQQEKLCAAIRSLGPELDRVQQHCKAQLSLAPQTGSDSGRLRLRETIARLNEIQSTVKRLNEAHQLLLRRSRRTVGALLNSYHSFAMTYSNPSSASASAEERL
ncbi:MAG TPA: flagellar export chaperone FlgN [Methylomirabilota bacterium]|nr:flagellar export chaperone FlgN [Methylomirabilota bacterium]